MVVPLLALSLFLGLYPKPALDRIEPSVRRAVADLEHKSDYKEPDPPAIAKKVTGAAKRRRRFRTIDVDGDYGTTEDGKGRGRSGHAERRLARRSRPSSRSAAPRCSSCCRVRCCANGPPRCPSRSCITFTGLVAAGATLAWQWFDVRDDGPIVTFGDMVRVDPFGVFLGIVVVIATTLAVLAAVAYLHREQLEAPEYLALMLFSALGMVIMTTAADLIVVFLALEILSIPLYVLAAFDRRRLSSQEAGIKYFVLGAFSSAVFLYGIALVYGATGSTSLVGDPAVPREPHAVRAGHPRRRAHAPARRPRLQGRGGAVPHVDARRVPGRAHARHHLHGVGHQGGRVRRAAARVRHRVPAVPRPTGARRCGCSRCSRSRSAASARCSRPTSSGCSPTRRSRTRATCSWRSRWARPRASKRRSSTCSCTRSWSSGRSRS